MKKESATAYFDTSLLYTKMAFAQSFWTVTARSATGTTQSLRSDAAWNETHWRDKSFDKLICDGQRRAERRRREAALA